MSERRLQSGVELLVAGRVFSGWQTISVQRGMEHCAGGFRLSVSTQGNALLPQWPIIAGQFCELRLDGRVVITGYVDEVSRSIDAEAHSIEVTGRDATADLVDCSAIRKAGQWRGMRIEQIATELANPFNVPVTTEIDTGKPLTTFALQEGETVFDAISRAARIRGLLLMTDGQGGLLITRAGEKRIDTPLVLGSNLLKASVHVDARDRYSDYMLKGQAPGSDYFNATAAAHVFARAKDPGVMRYRPLILTADCPDIALTLVERAKWEANLRWARSLQVEAVVQGWQHANGVWEPNRVVHFKAPALQLEGDLLIAGVEFSLSLDGGSTSKLSLTHADAFKVLPIKNNDLGAGYWSLPPKGGK